MSISSERKCQLHPPLERLDKTKLYSYLSLEAKGLLKQLHLLEEVDSTNTFLMERASQNTASIGCVCLAEAQTSGRGRLGRQWISPFGTNLYLSVLWRLEESLLTGLSLAVGVAVACALTDLGVRDVRLKWPNDVLIYERKLGGILIEVMGDQRKNREVVIGIGINRFLPPHLEKQIDQPCTDLARSISIPLPSKNELASALLNRLLPLLAEYPEKKLAFYLPLWRSFHAFEGREVVISQGETSFRGHVLGIANEGQLHVHCDDGKSRWFVSGDVQLRSLPS